VSSTYRVLCLAHEPALTLAPEWSRPEDAEMAVAKPTEDNGLAEHADCDLLIGRYSYPLIEVGCPASKKGLPASHYPYHPHDTEWMDIAWLRLLWMARDYLANDEDPYLRMAVDKAPGCWSAQRLTRLAPELRLELLEVPF
jgi:hypothetical protein